jgi:uncharacterized membrane protein
MESIPLHPLLVHLPLALAVLFPLVAGAAFFLMLRGRPRTWWVVLAVVVALAGSAYLAAEAGESDEDRIRGLVGRDALHDHEERAEVFVSATFVLLLLVLPVPLLGRRRRVQRALAGTVLVAGLAVAGSALAVGHSGGELVYRHGAATAWAATAGGVSDGPAR